MPLLTTIIARALSFIVNVDLIISFNKMSNSYPKKTILNVWDHGAKLNNSQVSLSASSSKVKYIFLGQINFKKNIIPIKENLRMIQVKLPLFIMTHMVANQYGSNFFLMYFNTCIFIHMEQCFSFWRIFAT
jgi:hypothetical protein